jgi:prophage antirepressor-like protein
MSNILKFKHEMFGEIRTMTDEQGEPWFVGKDVAKALGYKNAPDAISKHVDDEDRGTIAIRDSAFETRAVIINESGLYSLILSSKLPQAKEFKRWVTSEVLPAIRRTGRYELTSQELKQLATSAEYADQVLLSVNCYTMTQVAKELGMSVWDLTRLLMRRGIVYWQSGVYMLYADYARLGYARTRTDWRKGRDGRTHTDVRLVWTERGRQFIHGVVKLDNEIDNYLNNIEFC